MLLATTVAVLAPVTAEGRATVCTEHEVAELPGTYVIFGGECRQIDLGVLGPGTVVEIDLSADVAFDFLVFRANALPVYNNDQNYRDEAYWVEETVFESLSGDAKWHWRTPTDVGASRWYIVLDNLAHAGDGGEGAQGTEDLQIDIDVTYPNQPYWTLYDGLVRLDANNHMQLLADDVLSLDEGTQLSISAIPLTGTPDLFLLTEAQRDGYLAGTGASFRVNGADLFNIVSEDSVAWTVPAEHAGEGLWLFADNRDGPTGGGDGNAPAAFTVIVSMMPVLDATVDAPGGDLDVGASRALSANNTPAASGQVDLALSEWDVDGDGTTDHTGAWVAVDYDTPGDHDVRLTVHGPDGRQNTHTHTVVVRDATAPTAGISGSSYIRGFNEDVTVYSNAVDNHQIAYEQWWVNGELYANQTGTNNALTIGFASAGEQTIEVRPFDPSGLSGSATVTVTVRDTTPAVIGAIAGPNEVTAGNSATWSATATDGESGGLIFNWDFDNAVDIDGDGDPTNDAEMTGSSATHTFESAGNHWVTLTVTNGAGLNATQETLVVVAATPSSGAGAGGAVMTLLYVFIALVILGGGGFFLWRRWADAQAEVLLVAQAAAAAEAAATAEPAPQITSSDPHAGFRPAGGGGGGYGARAAASDEIAAIAGPGYGAAASVGGAGDDLLSAFEEPAPTPAPTPEPEPKPEPQPAAAAPAASNVLASGIALPSNLKSEPAPEPAPAAAPEPEPEPPAFPAVEVISTCTGCDKRFAVDLPEGLESAQTDCPACGVRNAITR